MAKAKKKKGRSKARNTRAITANVSESTKILRVPYTVKKKSTKILRVPVYIKKSKRMPFVAFTKKGTVRT